MKTFLEVAIVCFHCFKRGKTTLLLICLVTMNKIAGVEGGKHAVVQYIFGSETNNLALENIKIPGSSRRMIGWMRAT
jgi:hypothetical protein